MVKVVLLGAGSVEFTHQLSTDLFRFDDLPPLQIVLYDIDQERLAFAWVTAEQAAARFGRPADIVTTLDRRAALDGADYVINVIAVGGLPATRKDLEIPARMGLRQTVGDTTGVGGVFRALRTFPVLTQLAKDMVEVCPDAWFLNYTNPMAMNVWWMSVVAPEIRSVGLCHSIYWTVNDLCELIGVPMEGTRFRAAGVNHLSWLTEWSREARTCIRGSGPLRRRPVQRGDDRNRAEFARVAPGDEHPADRLRERHRGAGAPVRLQRRRLARDGADPLTLADARRTLELSAAVHASSFTGRPVRAREIGPGHPFYSATRGIGAPWDEPVRRRPPGRLDCPKGR